MLLQPTELKSRLSVSFVCVVTLAFLFVRATAFGHAFGTFGSFAHPWQDSTVDVLIFSLAAVSFVCLVPLIWRGRRIQRLAAVFLLLLPICVFSDFIFWLFRVYES